MPDDANHLSTPEPITTSALCDALEALLFAARTPMKKAALRASIKRVIVDQEGEPLGETDPKLDDDAKGAAADEAALASPGSEGAAESQEPAIEAMETLEPSEPEAEPFTLSSPEAPQPSMSRRFDAAFRLLEERWANRDDRGFGLVQVAEGWAFRTHPRFGPMLRREREGRPGRLSKPALEALAIVAYQQPVTKPEIDHLRGVDSGGGLKVLLERQLIEVTGKKDEPGRPLLYATTSHFLDFFALPALGELPSLRQYQELHDEHLAQSKALGLTDLAALAGDAPKLAPTDHQAAQALADAMESLGQASAQARAAFAEHGIRVHDEEMPAARGAAGNESTLH